MTNHEEYKRKEKKMKKKKKVNDDIFLDFFEIMNTLHKMIVVLEERVRLLENDRD